MPVLTRADRACWEAGKRFYRLQRAYGVELVRSGIRAGAVTVA